MLPLSGIKVLDLSRVLAGPYCGMILADLGAYVVKIERPGRGDDSREFGPFVNGESAYFMSINRNKKSVTLNLKSPEGKEIFKELVKHFDVVVENFRPGTMEKLGLGYDVLKKINSRLIYAASSGFGYTGPYRERPAYDAIIQAMGGLMSITGFPGGKPTRVGASIADIATGMFCAIGVLAALVKRQVTGEGDMVDVAMLDSVVALLENAIARYEVTGELPKPLGNRHPSIFPFESFEAQDGDIIIAAGNDELWAKLCRAIGKEELANDPRFRTNQLRGQNYNEMKKILDDIIKTKTVEEWIKILEDAGVPCSPINTIDRVVQHPQVLARDMIVKVRHAVAGEIKMPGCPIKFASENPKIGPAPILAEHTEEVLKEFLGIGDEELARLKASGVI
ncbi:CaiB/BaiF CoA transferase family protein [Thermosediminibacter litoriperuensis]|uniref:CoA:oxalate CoA-transferase n=1 Tax=Thermosediminibacter litoriperuensis TaxID=291989 RepID=A0A5S5AE87_9FIRM|nr:CaiB/BaiF CoA-transferase family protein [Thermosediminibacter litoriperuensis]TYP47436.1 CoA:oxalate CoA-transferase [Thermosediminibacter litoriperuensis]